MLKACFTLLLALSVSACAPSSSPLKSKISLPQKWQTSLPSKERKSASDENKHQDEPLCCFQDSQLSLLFKLAHQNNCDLKKAAAHLNKAKAMCGIRFSALFPQIAAQGLASYNSLSENTTSGRLLSSTSKQANLFDVNFDVSWEIDLFGKIAAAKEASKEEVLALENLERSLKLSLDAEIARNYIQWQNLHLQRDLLEDSLVQYEKLSSLAQAKVNANISSKEELAYCQINEALAKAALLTLERDTQKIVRRLEVLTGQVPGSLDSLLKPQGPVEVINLPEVGFPSELLKRRPDLLAAENNLKRALAASKVAELDFYPSFTLYGALGNQAMHLGDLSKGSSRYWSLVPGLQLPLFHAGKLKEQLKAARADELAALADFESTLLLALEEVENALSGLSWAQELTNQQRKVKEAAEEIWKIALKQYTEGTLTFQKVLESYNSYLEAQNQYANVQSKRALYAASLCKALGGSW